MSKRWQYRIPGRLIFSSIVDRERSICALRTAYNIWKARELASHDARRASIVLRAMMQRLTKQTPTNSAPGVDRSMPTPVSDPPRQPESQPAGYEVPPSDCVQMNDLGSYKSGLLDFMPLDSALNDPTNLDWVSWRIARGTVQVIS